MGGRGRRHQGRRDAAAMARGDARRRRRLLRCGFVCSRAPRDRRRSDDAALRAVAELAAALVPSKERFLETTAQGRAFLDATKAAWPCPALMRLEDAWQGAVALPVAVGSLAPDMTSPVSRHLARFSMRSPPIGSPPACGSFRSARPTDNACSPRSKPSSRQPRDARLATPLDEIGSAAFRADLATMRHETQYTRLFRS